jgi:hypothetical protein
MNGSQRAMKVNTFAQILAKVYGNGFLEVRGPLKEVRGRIYKPRNPDRSVKISLIIKY